MKIPYDLRQITYEVVHFGGKFYRLKSPPRDSDPKVYLEISTSAILVTHEQQVVYDILLTVNNKIVYEGEGKIYKRGGRKKPAIHYFVCKIE